eukprot:1776192-Rhodomonas_salina.3
MDLSTKERVIVSVSQTLLKAAETLAETLLVTDSPRAVTHQGVYVLTWYAASPAPAIPCLGRAVGAQPQRSAGSIP